MKPKYFLLGFFALSILAFSSMVHAQTTYSLGVSEGSQWAFTIVKEEGNVLTGSEGETMTLTITSITETDSYWTIKYQILNNEQTHPSISKDPSVGDLVLFICPTTVSTYLTDLAKAWNDVYGLTSLGDIATASGNTWALDFQGTGYEITYDSTTGWATNYKQIEDGVVQLELTGAAASSGGIPGYELPILLGISAIFTIGLILLKKKRM